MQVRNRFSERVPVKRSFEGAKSRTKQSMRDECNVNNIMAKYKKTGLVPVATGQAVYADVSGEVDYLEMQRRVIAVGNIFQRLPASLRARFDHDPAKYIEFITNPANDEEAVKLGLKYQAKIKDAEGVESDAPAPIPDDKGIKQEIPPKEEKA